MDNPAKPNRHVRIDNRILDNLVPRIGSHAFTVYAMLVKYADNTTRRCYPSIATLATRTGLSRPTVIRAIHTLQAAGMLTVERQRTARGDWANNVYTLTNPANITMARAPEADSPDGDGEGG